MSKYSEEARRLYPYLLPLFERSLNGNGGSGGGTGSVGGVPNPHGLSSVYHTGTLANSQAPQFLLVNGSRKLTGHLLVDPLITIDGVDLSAHVLNPNAHHNQQHLITGGDHSIVGSALQLVGATATNVLGLLTPSMSPGAGASILRTDTDGSLYLDTNLLYVDAPNNRVGVNRAPGAAALDVLAAANADHTLRVKQKSGQTGRLWRVEDSAGSELIVLDSVGDLQSGQPGFVSGLTGWQISHLGNAEFNNIWARGELHATVFVKDEVHATGGTFFVATAGTLYADAVIDSSTDSEALEIKSTVVGFGTDLDILSTASGVGSTLEIEAILNFIDINDPPSGPGFYFDEYDVVRSKTEIPTGVADLWFQIVSALQLDGFARYSVLVRSGSDGTLPAGSAVVSYGVPGDGRILMTSDLNYAPYIDVFTVGPNVWSGAAGAIIPHVRLGRLDGVGVAGASGIEQYGMIAGTDLSDADSPYIVASNLQLRLHKVDLTANDGTNDTVELTSTGNLTLGANIASDAGKSFQVLTTGASAGDVIMGQLAGNYCWYDDSAGAMEMSGSVVVGENSFVRSEGMVGYAVGDAGFFLGWDTDAFKFSLGDDENNLLWDGEALSLTMSNPLGLRSIAPDYVAINFSVPLGVVHRLTFDAAGELAFPDGNVRVAGTIFGGLLNATGDRMRIGTSFTPASAAAAGTKGDIAYDTSFIYICTATNTWRRIAHATW